MVELEGKRILIVGASSGIGRATALLLAQEGARVVAAARRLDRLEAIAAEATKELVAMRCDVRDPESCEQCVTASVEALGGLDAIVYATGVATLRRLADADAEIWREAVEINLIGASLLTRAALPHLVQSSGRALYLSSIAADDRPPRTGLALYSASKQALNRMIECWQQEERAVAFTQVSVGDTGATEMAAEWDADASGQHIKDWLEQGFLFGRMMVPESVARHVAQLLAGDEAVPISTIVPRYPTEAS